MLNDFEARGIAAGRIAAARARLKLVQVLREGLPGVTVEVEDGDVVLGGRLDLNDARLRWIGSFLL